MVNHPTILVITDNPPIRYWIKKHLENQFSLIDAHTETKAIETVKTSHLDFIVLDGTFEECDPIELVSKLRNAAPQMPFAILFITGRLKKSYRDSAIASGVTDFLSDQLDAEELQTKITTGKKTTQIRQKVSGLASLITTPKVSEQTTPFKSVQFISKAKAILIVQIDQFSKLPSQDELEDAVFELLKKDHPDVTMSTAGQFLIQLTSADPKETAHNLHKKIQSHTFKTAKGPVKITASFALSKVSKESFDKTLLTASKALKQSAKQKGSFFNIDHEIAG